MVSIERNQQIPEEFLSSIIKAKGFASYNEVIQISPSNTFNQTATNELIKFQFKTPDYIDPYDIYFDVQVESYDIIDSGPKQYKLYLEGSSSSLFQEVQIYCRSKHVETIRQHDEVMQIVNSVGFDPDNAPSQAYLGFAQNNPEGNSARQPSNFKTYKQDAANVGQAQSYYVSTQSHVGYLPHKGLPRPTYTQQVNAPWSQYHAKHLISQHYHSTTYPMYGQHPSDLGRCNSPYFPYDISNNEVLSRIQSQLAPNANVQSAALFEHGGSRCELLECLDGSLGVQGINKPAIYEDSPATDYNGTGGIASAPANNVYHFQKTQHLGFQTYWSSATAEGNKCQSLNYGYGSSWLKHGEIQDQPQMTNTLRLSVPLNSGVFGTLLPEHKLIPGESLGHTEIQVRLNPYAFFASGLKRAADNADQGKGQIDLTAYQIPRLWKIKSIQLIIHTYSFDEAFTRQLQDQLRQGITLRSNGFDFAQSTSVPDSRFLQGSWPIITGIQSLKALYVYFLADDYLSKTFCRKHFRISGNVLSMQLKLNADYYPRKPLEGHAGNPVPFTDDYRDNSEFVVWYQKQLGFFNTKNYTSVNRVNFAINDRSYDPTLSATGVDVNSKPIYKDYLLLGLPGQEEQRYVGKALYPFAFVQKPQRPNVLQGIDVSNLKPFELLIKTDQVNYYPRPCTLMILQHFNIEVSFTNEGVNVYGYA